MTSDEKFKACSAALALWDQGELDKASDILKRVLAEDVNYGWAVKLMAHVHEKAGNQAIAYHLFKRATELDPQDGNALANFGRVAQDMWRTQEAERAQLRAVSLVREPKEKARALTNLAALKCDLGQWLDCEKLSRKALEYDPQLANARANLGFAQLAQHNWAEGWANYRYTLGHDWRKRVNYKGEPEWQGEPGQTVVVYGEQGIGDEISFASVLPDMIEHSGKVIVDCDARLAGLFRRSFPRAKVYGTRFAKSGAWDKADCDFDASIAIGQLGEYFRTSADAFPGTPYLTPCPDRVHMWKSLFALKAKPIIGIAWRGGTPKSGGKFRQWSLEQLLPVLRAVNAHWVVLEYKSAAKELAAFTAKYPDIDIAEYPYGTQTADYDDTAALVAACDRVVCMQTAVAHLGGALGQRTDVFVPRISQWRYGQDSMPWYRSLTVHRQQTDDWRRELEQFAEALSADFRSVPRAASNAA